MGLLSRRKGQRVERAAAKALRSFGFGDVRRTVQGRGGSDAADLEGLPWRVEIKGGSVRYVKPRAALAQCQRDAAAANPPDLRPCIALTRVDRGEWLVTVPLHVLLEIGAMPAHGFAMTLPIVTLTLRDFTIIAHEGLRALAMRSAGAYGETP